MELQQQMFTKYRWPLFNFSIDNTFTRNYFKLLRDSLFLQFKYRYILMNIFVFWFLFLFLLLQFRQNSVIKLLIDLNCMLFSIPT